MQTLYQLVNTKTGAVSTYTNFANDSEAIAYLKRSPYYPEYLSLINLTTGTVIHKSTKSDLEKPKADLNNNNTILIVVAIVIIIAIAYFAMRK
jgi:hypothetical protein